MGAVERQTQKEHSKIEARHLARYKIAKEYCIDKNVLDIASGCGYGTALLAEVATTILGGDYSSEAIEYARTNWNSSNTTYKQVNIKDLPVLGQFDVVVSFETVEHIDHDLIKTLEFYKSNLKQDGLLIFSHPENETDAKINPFHHHFNIKKTDILPLLESIGFELVEYKEQQGYAGHYNYSIYVLKHVNL